MGNCTSARHRTRTNYATGCYDWLTSEGIDSASFGGQIAFNLKLEKLKATVTEPNLQEYFIERKLILDRVVLSRLVVEERSLALELKSQIVEDDPRFEQLAQEYSSSRGSDFQWHDRSS